MNDSSWLELASTIAQDHIAPLANVVDQQSAPPIDNIRRLATAGLLGMTTPARYGGLGAQPETVRAYTETLAGSCGVTNFVQGQHQSACNLIAGADNEDLKHRLLPTFASGEKLCGVAFSHLRRKGPPVMRATPESGGYRFDGIAPWLTGWGVMDETVLGGTLPDGRLLYAVVPLDSPEISASEPMKLCAMNASGTVELTCQGLWIGPEMCMKTITTDQMSSNDMAALLAVTPQIFGHVGACLRLLGELGTANGNTATVAVLKDLENEMTVRRSEVDALRARIDDNDYCKAALRVRVQCMEMSIRAAHACVAAIGGSGNNRGSSAQRLFREAMFYSLTAQTRDIQTATLELLAERSRSAVIS